MEKIHFFKIKTFDGSASNILEEGAKVVVGRSYLRRVLRVGARGALYVKNGTKKNPKRKRYLSSGGIWVILDDTTEVRR